MIGTQKEFLNGKIVAVEAWNSRVLLYELVEEILKNWEKRNVSR